MDGNTSNIEDFLRTHWYLHVRKSFRAAYPTTISSVFHFGFFLISYTYPFVSFRAFSMDTHRLRGILLRLQDRLTNDDRCRLHFFLSNDCPRCISDDPTLAGTLSLMQSLFDQDKINGNDCNFLINTFDEIQCHDAAKILRGALFFDLLEL